jgi:GTPase SAR1 family protein
MISFLIIEERTAMNNSILIIGHPESGKTTFLAQFFTRIKKRKSSITLSKTPENIMAITNAVKMLADGEEPTTTPADENVELVLPIKVDGINIDLICPDYGGEQVNDITELMGINNNWTKLANSSDQWILFIRPDKITPEYDLSISSYEEIETKKSTSFAPPGLSEQSKFIELLQALLYTKNIGIKHPNSVPKLSITLTCWDELKTERKPVQILQEKLPMLHHFVETVWEKGAFEIFGLSAQEFPLNTQKAKDKYLDELPENFGYMIDQDGVKDKDITKLVKMVLQ